MKSEYQGMPFYGPGHSRHIEAKAPRRPVRRLRRFSLRQRLRKANKR